MSRLKKIIRNTIISGVLLFIFFTRMGFHLNPLSAHKDSERSIHYGPSQVVHVENFSGGKYILCKYDKWVSCNTVNRTLGFLWRFGNQPIGFENHKSKGMDYMWDGVGKYGRLYGIINNTKIKRVQITFGNRKTLSQTKFYSNLFLFTWMGNSTQMTVLKNIKGYDLNGKVVFEGKI